MSRQDGSYIARTGPSRPAAAKCCLRVEPRNCARKAVTQIDLLAGNATHDEPEPTGIYHENMLDVSLAIACLLGSGQSQRIDGVLRGAR